MQSFGLPGPMAGPGKDVATTLQDLDSLDVDHLLSYFQPASNPLSNPLGFDPTGLMNPAVPFRGTAGASGSLPGALPGMPAQPPTANLFSSIVMTEATGLHDSGDSTGNAGHGGKRSSEDRSQAIQEKNRRAQKRFRERQAS
ncbi:hypothetical protein N2152v2_006417 [Parachlorella kessleri]